MCSSRAPEHLVCCEWRHKVRAKSFPRPRSWNLEQCSPAAHICRLFHLCKSTHVMILCMYIYIYTNCSYLHGRNTYSTYVYIYIHMYTIIYYYHVYFFIIILYNIHIYISTHNRWLKHTSYYIVYILWNSDHNVLATFEYHQHKICCNLLLILQI